MKHYCSYNLVLKTLQKVASSRTWMLLTPSSIPSTCPTSSLILPFQLPPAYSFLPAPPPPPTPTLKCLPLPFCPSLLLLPSYICELWACLPIYFSFPVPPIPTPPVIKQGGGGGTKQVGSNFNAPFVMLTCYIVQIPLKKSL